MRRVRMLFVATLVVAFGLVLGPGCRDATQITVDVSLTKLAHCTETNGTAITVGVDPATAEDRVAHEYVTATTLACDAATGEIGTLVLTPSSSGRASVIVVVAYDKTVTAASCKPPLFKGCIVARRQFSFTDHRHLTMPITIDPNCKDVPCDAFSTCRTGTCFPSEAACSGDTCTEPGDPGDGGTDVDGQVIPDTGVPVDGAVVDGEATDGSDGSIGTDASMMTDGGADAALPDSGEGGVVTPASVYCSDTNQLECSAVACDDSRSCCGSTDGSAAACQAGMVSCGGAAPRQYCCPGTTSCPAGQSCSLLMKAGPEAGVGGMIIPVWTILPVGATPAGVCQ